MSATIRTRDRLAWRARKWHTVTRFCVCACRGRGFHLAWVAVGYSCASALLVCAIAAALLGAAGVVAILDVLEWVAIAHH